ncbi:MAG: hypothetical protein EAY75_16100 [Bacteroidetes bacterium]|nr:MAG: hypothetical protein EAY75_16100 [Bacteroidota bacterium]
MLATYSCGGGVQYSKIKQRGYRWPFLLVKLPVIWVKTARKARFLIFQRGHLLEFWLVLNLLGVCRFSQLHF